MEVISASYRTDIPAFYGDWFMQRVREGYARYKNPYGPQVVTVSLKPPDVHAVVFWSKNYMPFMRHLDELEQSGLDYYFHYTITGQPRILEERVPDWHVTVANMHGLARRYTPRHVQWRYDPIVISDKTPVAFHLDMFGNLCRQIEGATTRCYISFVDLYKKVLSNLRPLQDAITVAEPAGDLKRTLTEQLGEIAAQHGISVFTCSEDDAVCGLVQRGSCIDKHILDELWPAKARRLGLSSARGGCGCYVNRDIGGYDTCPHGCVYCYAVLNRPLALRRYQEHDVLRDCLVDVGPNVPPDGVGDQLRLF